MDSRPRRYQDAEARLPLRRAVGALCGLAAFWVSSLCAAGDKERCASAYESAQRLQRQGSLLESREELGVCLRECAEIVRPECARWLAEVEEALPSIVIAVKRADGSDVKLPQIAVNQRSVSADGRATELNPGTHRIEVDAEGQRLTQEIVLREGERGRHVVLSLPPAPMAPAASAAPREPPPHEPSARTIPLASWVLGGVAAGGVAGFAGFALYGESRYRDLEACRPRCTTTDIEATKATYLVADVSLAVAIVSLGAAVATYFLWPTGEAPRAALAQRRRP